MNVPNTGGLKSGLAKFGDNKYVQGGRDFLQSNGLVAKFAFLLLVVILFVLILSLATALMAWIFQPSPSPILIDGMINAKHMKVFPQNPSASGAVPILRSQNDAGGMEFTWSVWIFVEDFLYKQDEYKHVFHKGNYGVDVGGNPPGMSKPNNAPGLYIAPKTNALVVVMNTFDQIEEKVTIPDLPLNKWVNVIIRLDHQRQLDVFINGVLTERLILSDVARQNYGDVFAALNGGFDGYISSLRYFNWAIGTNRIQDIVDAGPNMKMEDDTLKNSKPHYLSTRWFFTGLGDEYNPVSG